MDISIAQMTLGDSGKIRDIDRSETIEHIYTWNNGTLESISAGHECPNWNEAQYQAIINRYEYELSNGGTAYGAYLQDQLVGFGVLAHKLRGSQQNQLQLDLMYVSRAFRRQGIGKQLMDALCKAAQEKGAEHLYISSTETESAVKFYSNCGSSLTPEVDKELFAKEPLDIHMLKKL